MKHLSFFSLFLFASVGANGQTTTVDKDLFRSPVNYPITLAGNFGEPRSSHLHCGIDFKTGGVEGKEMFALADGYISRLTVSYTGYGLALYVTHPDLGYTAIYGHLRNYIPELEEVLNSYRYAHQTESVDIRFSCDDFPVRQGDLIAYSGNSGSSAGPHLHLELRRLEDNAYMNPLLFFSAIKDDVAPKGHEIMLYPKPNEGVLNGEVRKQAFKLIGDGVSDKIFAWGKVGSAIWMDDYMTGVNNRFGIWRMVLRVDGKELFSSQVDCFLPNEPQQVYSWGDYVEYISSKRWYMKTFRDPGNTLHFLHTDERRGWVEIDEERDYLFEYELTDYSGNTSRYSYTLTGLVSDFPADQEKSHLSLLKWNQVNIIQDPGMQMDIALGALPDDIWVNPQRFQRPESLSDAFRISDSPVPLLKRVTLMLAPNRVVEDISKLYIVGSVGGPAYYVGGEFSDGWMSAEVRDLRASYWLELDTVAPKLIPQRADHWGKTGVVTFKISDAESGIASYKAFLESEFILFHYTPRTGIITCKLANTPIKRTHGVRKLELQVVDKCGNITLKDFEVTY